MNQMYLNSLEGVEQQPLKTFAEKAYLDYSMYVIMDRALPHIADGLKPVQRRIIYAMSELGLKASAKYKKSARTVGDVLGKYHPHGDTACYEAMVLMAQSFSYRYPLIDGQGNWGSADDPKSFAAMRYTESRLSPYAEILLAELEQGTVNWGLNFDGTLEEPLLLPARLPNVLLNGTTGIAVGMATDIPPHNLKEITQACIYLLSHPEATLEEICRFVQGPDFPTEAEIITPSSDILEMYRKGTGSIRVRAVYVQEDNDIVITALPPQVSGAKVLEQIAAEMQAKKLPMLADLRDESDHENPTRLVIVPRSNRIDVEAVMNHLFAITDLERSYRVNLNMLGLNGRPEVKSLDIILKEWLAYRIATVRRRLQFRLDKVQLRLHILEGLMIAYLNLDEVITIIRQEESPKKVLMTRFNLTDTQAEAILELKLRHLAKLEEMKIRGEQAELAQERDSLEATLNSEKKLKGLIKEELLADEKKYGDKRRSPLRVRQEAQAIKKIDMVPNEPVTVILSTKGWVRAAKGHDALPEKLNYKAGDSFLGAALGRSNQFAVFLDSMGRAYSLYAHSLPSARGQGEPLTGRINPEEGATFIDVLMGNDEECFVLASDAGYGFIIKFEELISKNRSGKAILKLPKGASLLPSKKIFNEKTDEIVVVTNEGRLLIFPANDLPHLAKGKGNKMISIPADRAERREEFVVGVGVLPPQGLLKLYSSRRHITLKTNDLKNYRGERGRRGNKLPRGYQKIDRLEVIIEKD